MTPASQKNIQIAILDSHTFIRTTVSVYLNQLPNFEVVNEAATAEDYLQYALKNPAHVLVYCFYRPESAVLESIKKLREHLPELRIILLSTCADAGTVSNLLDDGVYGFISTEDPPDELPKAIQSASYNKIYRNLIFTEALYLNNEKKNRKESHTDFDDREKHILRLIWLEKNNQEIADVFLLSARSIEKIRQNMKTKLGVRSTIGLMKYALTNRIVELPQTGFPKIKAD